MCFNELLYEFVHVYSPVIISHFNRPSLISREQRTFIGLSITEIEVLLPPTPICNVCCVNGVAFHPHNANWFHLPQVLAAFGFESLWV